MLLSERLENIIEMLPPSVCAADVCCDHAHVAIELVRRGRAERVIACDLRPGPLQRARQHIREAGLSHAIETRLGDGLSPLRAGEADAVVLAGIGGDLLIRILQGRLRDFRAFVLSPQSMHGKVRRFLYENGMETQEERMLRDSGKYYLIMRVSHYLFRGAEFSDFSDNRYGKTADNKNGSVAIMEEYAFRYGFWLLSRKDAVLHDYLLKERARFETILRAGGQVRQEYEDCLRALEVYG